MTTFSREREDNWVRVFISHKEEDKELAFVTRQLLEVKCNNLRCFVSGAGYSHDWLNNIKSELASSDVLLLLFTSPAKQWDWPLYEVGLFTPLYDNPPGHAIVYLYTGEHRPAPLEHLQGVRVDPLNLGNIEKFLTQFYKTAEITGRQPPLLPHISKKEISSRAAKLAQAFMTSATVPIYPTYRLVLGAPINRNGGLSKDTCSIPSDCCVKEMTPPALSIFGFSQTPNTWGEILDTVKEDVDWKDELDVQFQNASNGRVAYPTSFTFRGLEDSRNFRAMITRIERADTRILRITIAFIPVHTPATIGGPAFNLLRMATRFQSEVIKSFFGQLDVWICKVGVERTFNSLLGSIRNIEREAAAFRFMDAATVASVFSQENSDRKIVIEMFENWGSLRHEIFLCADRKDVLEMERLLDELRISNTKFMRMVTRRHCELIERDAAIVLGEEN